MADVYSARLADAYEAAAGSGVAYTAPSGVVVVVRCITLLLFGGTTFGGIYRSASVAYLGALAGGAVLTVATIDMRHVLNAGESLTWQFQGGGGTWAISGYVLTAP